MLWGEFQSLQFMAHPGKASFTGLFRHTLDDKGRVTIPSAWRAAHPDGDVFLATPHPDGYVAVLPPAEVEKLHARGVEGEATTGASSPNWCTRAPSPLSS